jgi:hypothetical protein
MIDASIQLPIPMTLQVPFPFEENASNEDGSGGTVACGEVALVADVPCTASADSMVVRKTNAIESENAIANKIPIATLVI